MDNLIGRRLDGRYLIESIVGVGGMANVYRGQDMRTGAPIAVKVTTPTSCMSTMFPSLTSCSIS